MIGKAISHDRVIEKMGAVRGARSILATDAPAILRSSVELHSLSTFPSRRIHG